MILLGKHVFHHSCLNKFTFWYLIFQKKNQISFEIMDVTDLQLETLDEDGRFSDQNSD